MMKTDYCMVSFHIRACLIPQTALFRGCLKKSDTLACGTERNVGKASQALRNDSINLIKSYMERSIERVPTWALPYMANGDATGLKDKEIK